MNISFGSLPASSYAGASGAKKQAKLDKRGWVRILIIVVGILILKVLLPRN